MKVFSAKKYRETTEENVRMMIEAMFGVGWENKADGMTVGADKKLKKRDVYGGQGVIFVNDKWLVDTEERPQMVKEVEEWKRKYFQLKAKLAYIQQILDSKDGVIENER